MTLNEIEQRLDALQAEKDKLTAELERLKAEKFEVKPWRALPGGTYYSINWIGEAAIQKDIRGDISPLQYKCGNYYRTEALAEQDAKELALRGRVRQLRDALCEGYQYNNNPDIRNWVVVYDFNISEYRVTFSSVIQDIGVIWFDTKEHAQKACDILNAERRKESGGNG